jgi:hypothetical protein
VTSRNDSPARRLALAKLGAFVTAACVALLGQAVAPATAAPVKVRTFTATKVRHGVATFRLRGVVASDIRSARLRGGRSRRIPLRKVRRAARRGVLRVRVSSRRSAKWRRHRLRELKLVVVARRSRSCTTTLPLPFGVGNWPGACWRPYSDASPLNRPLPANPRLVTSSSAIVSRLLGHSLFEEGPENQDVGNAGTADDWSAPIYYAKPTDPVFTVQCTESWGRCEPEGRRIHIPDRAQPAGGGDAHLAVILPNGNEYDFWQVSRKDRGGGVLEASWGGITRIDGHGLGGNATAAGIGLAGGRVRAQELEAGRIDHALLMVVKCSSGGNVYPAEGGGGSNCSDRVDASGRPAPTMGMRFQLDYSDAEIDRLVVPVWKKAILRALAHYGMFVIDTGGGSWGYGAFEGGMTYESFGYEDRLVAYAREHRVPEHDGRYVFDMRSGVDWSRLRVIDPCVSRGSC